MLILTLTLTHSLSHLCFTEPPIANMHAFEKFMHNISSLSGAKLYQRNLNASQSVNISDEWVKEVFDPLADRIDLILLEKQNAIREFVERLTEGYRSFKGSLFPPHFCYQERAFQPHEEIGHVFGGLVVDLNNYQCDIKRIKDCVILPLRDYLNKLLFTQSFPESAVHNFKNASDGRVTNLYGPVSFIDYLDSVYTTYPKRFRSAMARNNDYEALSTGVGQYMDDHSALFDAADVFLLIGIDNGRVGSSRPLQFASKVTEKPYGYPSFFLHGKSSLLFRRKFRELTLKNFTFLTNISSQVLPVDVATDVAKSLLVGMSRDNSFGVAYLSSDRSYVYQDRWRTAIHDRNEVYNFMDDVVMLAHNQEHPAIPHHATFLASLRNILKERIERLKRLHYKGVYSSRRPSAAFDDGSQSLHTTLRPLYVYIIGSSLETYDFSTSTLDTNELVNQLADVNVHLILVSLVPDPRVSTNTFFSETLYENFVRRRFKLDVLEWISLSMTHYLSDPVVAETISNPRHFTLRMKKTMRFAHPVLVSLHIPSNNTVITKPFWNSMGIPVVSICSGIYMTKPSESASRNFLKVVPASFFARQNANVLVGSVCTQVHLDSIVGGIGLNPDATTAFLFDRYTNVVYATNQLHFTSRATSLYFGWTVEPNISSALLQQMLLVDRGSFSKNDSHTVFYTTLPYAPSIILYVVTMKSSLSTFSNISHNVTGDFDDICWYCTILSDFSKCRFFAYIPGRLFRNERRANISLITGFDSSICLNLTLTAMINDFLQNETSTPLDFNIPPLLKNLGLPRSELTFLRFISTLRHSFFLIQDAYANMGYPNLIYKVAAVSLEGTVFDPIHSNCSVQPDYDKMLQVAIQNSDRYSFSFVEVECRCDAASDHGVKCISFIINLFNKGNLMGILAIVFRGADFQGLLAESMTRTLDTIFYECALQHMYFNFTLLNLSTLTTDALTGTMNNFQRYIARNDDLQNLMRNELYHLWFNGYLSCEFFYTGGTFLRALHASSEYLKFLHLKNSAATKELYFSFDPDGNWADTIAITIIALKPIISCIHPQGNWSHVSCGRTLAELYIGTIQGFAGLVLYSSFTDTQEEVRTTCTAEEDSTSLLSSYVQQFYSLNRYMNKDRVLTNFDQMWSQNVLSFTELEYYYIIPLTAFGIAIMWFVVWMR